MYMYYGHAEQNFKFPTESLFADTRSFQHCLPDLQALETN